jgi:glycosyltransferase involved in cell wall biosynthesis
VPAIVSTTAMISSRYEVDELWRKALYRLIDLATDRIVDRYIVVNRASVAALTDRHRIAPGRVAVIPNGIELERYDPGRQRAGVWRRRLGVPDEAILVGGVGRLTWQKGFPDLVKAVAALDDPNIWLVLAGDGPDWGDLRALAGGLNVTQRVLFPGFVEDVPGLLADLDLFVLSSHREGHPMVLLEAMAMGLPVVATDIPGVDDTITEGVDGRLVPVADVPALVEAVRVLARDRDAADRMGRNARRKIEREYTVERMVRRTGVLYEQLLAEKGVTL